MRYILFSVFILASLSALGQDRDIDKLEMFYDQGHFKKVYRRSARLMADPYYDYSTLPGFYRALATIRRAEDHGWMRSNLADVRRVELLLGRFKGHEDYKHLKAAHGHEILAAEADMSTLLGHLSKSGNADLATTLESTWNELRKGLRGKAPEKEPAPVAKDTVSVVEIDQKEASEEGDLIADARELIGTPYKWAGTSPEQGFDCSGFTSYVYSKQGKQLPRRSSDQHAQVRKIGRSQVEPGDLVFFGKGKVSHVGIVSKVDEGKVFMVHASTSKGVIESEINSDPYWSARLMSYGRVL